MPAHIILWPTSWAVTDLDITISPRLQTPGLLHLLQNLPMLGSLTLSASGNDTNTLKKPINSPVSPLTSLRSLKVSRTIDLYILSTLNLPSLITFSVENFRWSGDNMEHLAMFLSAHQMLEDVALVGARCTDAPEELQLPITDLPSLLYLTISRAPGIFLQQLFAPYLSEIGLSHVEARAASALLYMTPNITRVKFDCLVYPQNKAQELLHAITCTGIASLDVDPTGLKWLDTATLPGLRALSIRKTKAKTHSVVGPILRRLLNRSDFPPLRSMHLEQLNISKEDFVWCLGQMGYMEELTLVDCNVAPEAWSRMADVIALPRLRWLNIEECSSATPPRLVRMVQARNTAISAIALPNAIASLRVRVRFRGDCEDVTPATLDELQLCNWDLLYTQCADSSNRIGRTG
ncbi:hypothetical protein BOTBODRAFT_629726 [Botryobasidium botryosum FD-172 SS1]|uniref:F-box domain-containing protein n=1 Tax=Botryobasidium botryosum (strain FD-172 SS1) TaxID=930990 RepID=A0A067MHJ8_BOTB1|nr:hypothetical protein BOTBODRAFT_629726 [Botryobasidium botryosum FD-172 SS1]